jgi:hypothetical protein
MDRILCLEINAPISKKGIVDFSLDNNKLTMFATEYPGEGRAQLAVTCVVEKAVENLF